MRRSVAARIEAPTATRPETERVMTACVFAIATGRWLPGDPVPSVRKGAERWGVAPATVHHAYSTLVRRGVLRAERRKGYFVRSGGAVDHLVRHSDALAELYAEVRALLESRTELSPLGVFRHLSWEAERAASARPECAFVECTLSQARRLALEVEERLRLPCRPLALHEVEPGWEPPPGLRVLMTTAFHAPEVTAAAHRTGLRALSVPLVCAEDEVAELSREAVRLAIRSADPEQGRLVAEDIRRVLGDATPEIDVRAGTPATVDADVAEALGSPDHPTPGVAVIVSMYLWEALDERWRIAVVQPYPYRVDPAAWTGVAAGLGLPLTV